MPSSPTSPTMRQAQLRSYESYIATSPKTHAILKSPLQRLRRRTSELVDQITGATLPEAVVQEEQRMTEEKRKWKCRACDVSFAGERELGKHLHFFPSHVEFMEAKRQGKIAAGQRHIHHAASYSASANLGLTLREQAEAMSTSPDKAHRNTVRASHKHKRSRSSMGALALGSTTTAQTPMALHSKRGNQRPDDASAAAVPRLDAHPGTRGSRTAAAAAARIRKEGSTVNPPREMTRRSRSSQEIRANDVEHKFNTYSPVTYKRPPLQVHKTLRDTPTKTSLQEELDNDASDRNEQQGRQSVQKLQEQQRLRTVSQEAHQSKLRADADSPAAQVAGPTAVLRGMRRGMSDGLLCAISTMPTKPVAPLQTSSTPTAAAAAAAAHSPCKSVSFGCQSHADPFDSTPEPGTPSEGDEFFDAEPVDYVDPTISSFADWVNWTNSSEGSDVASSVNSVHGETRSVQCAPEMASPSMEGLPESPVTERTTATSGDVASLPVTPVVSQPSSPCSPLTPADERIFQGLSVKPASLLDTPAEHSDSKPDWIPSSRPVPTTAPRGARPMPLMTTTPTQQAPSPSLVPLSALQSPRAAASSPSPVSPVLTSHSVAFGWNSPATASRPSIDYRASVDVPQNAASRNEGIPTRPRKNTNPFRQEGSAALTQQSHTGSQFLCSVPVGPYASRALPSPPTAAIHLPAHDPPPQYQASAPSPLPPAPLPTQYINAFGRRRMASGDYPQFASHNPYQHVTGSGYQVHPARRQETMPAAVAASPDRGMSSPPETALGTWAEAYFQNLTLNAVPAGDGAATSNAADTAVAAPTSPPRVSRDSPRTGNPLSALRPSGASLSASSSSSAAGGTDNSDQTRRSLRVKTPWTSSGGRRSSSSSFGGGGGGNPSSGIDVSA